MMMRMNSSNHASRKRMCSLALQVLVLVPALTVSAQDWPMFGGSPARNNATTNNATKGDVAPTDWYVGRFDRKTRSFEESRNIKWIAPLGSQSYGSPVVADGRVFVGTNNVSGYSKWFPNGVDLGCLICLHESDGRFLWQHSNVKLPTGRIHDWPLQGICSSPLVEGNRMWYVSNRGEIVCLDTEGFHDDEDDGPVKNEPLRLFDVSLDRLARQIVEEQLNLAARDKKISLPDEWRLYDKVPRQSWIVSGYKRMGRLRRPGPTLYNIWVVGDNLNIAESGNDDSLADIVTDFPMGAQQAATLISKLSPQFAKHGIDLPDQFQLDETIPGKRWSLMIPVDDQQQEIEIHMDSKYASAFVNIGTDDKSAADVVWRLDMMNRLGVRQHNMAGCSPASYGDLLFVCTSNGVDQTHAKVPAPSAPSFVALDKTTGELRWADRSPGLNILHGQWASPAVGVFEGVPQVIFAGGNGWLYSFRADKWDEKHKRPLLLWKFDGNDKESKWALGGRGTRNNIVASPVIYNGLIYFAMGQDPEHGVGSGRLWCIDPKKRGDVSPRLAMKIENGQKLPIVPRRIQSVDKTRGELTVSNPNSAVIWSYDQCDHNGDGKIDFEEEFHRTIARPAIKNGLVFATDIGGLVHCLDAKTGKVHWGCDQLATCWSTPMIVGDKVYVGDEDGDVAILHVSPDPSLSIHQRMNKVNGTVLKYDAPLKDIHMDNSIYTEPIFANGTLFIANRSHLFAIGGN